MALNLALSGTVIPIFVALYNSNLSFQFCKCLAFQKSLKLIVKCCVYSVLRKMGSYSESKPEEDPIFRMVDEDNITAVRDLLTADWTAIYRQDADGKQRREPLHHAALAPVWPSTESHAKLEMAKLLLSRGALVNSRDMEFFTPLHYAIMKGREKMCNLLLTNGARYDLSTENGSVYPFKGEARALEVTEALIR